MNESFRRLLADHYRLLALTAAGVLVLLGVFLIAATVNALSDDDLPNQNTITVTGTGKAETPPTIATVSFTVEEKAATVKAAQEAAIKKTNAALDAVKALGVEDADIQTTGYNSYPDYGVAQPCYPGSPCTQGTQKILGYQVNHMVTVKVRDTEKVGGLLKVLGDNGVQNISGPSFEVDDPTAVTREARAKAIEDARSNARELARELHVRLGDVVSYSDNNSPYPMPQVYKGGVAMDATASREAIAPTVPAGQNQTTVSVTVTYEIH